MAQITESFESFAKYMEKYKELAGGGRLYKIKAIHVTMTGNKRSYTHQELLKSGRSLSDRPITLNHKEQLMFDGNNQTLDNRTLDSEYNEDEQCVETLVRIIDPRVNELYDAGKIKHVSIEGKARDANEVDGIEPMGVVFTGLAFVTEDNSPGDPATTIQMVETIKISEIVAIGEPFAGYKDFKDCVAKNQGKEDPEGYCATIMRKVEGNENGGEKEMSTQTEAPLTSTEEMLEEEILELVDSVSEESFDAPSIEEAKKWIQKIGLKKGALHSQLGIPQGQKIPVSTLQRAAKKPGKLGARARLALKFRTFKHCMDSVKAEELLGMAREALVDPPTEDLVAEIKAIKEASRRNDERIRADVSGMRESLLKLNQNVEGDVKELKSKVKEMGENMVVKTELSALEDRVKADLGKKIEPFAPAMENMVKSMRTGYDEVTKMFNATITEIRDTQKTHLAETVKVKDEQLAVQDKKIENLQTEVKESLMATKLQMEKDKNETMERVSEVLAAVKEDRKRQDAIETEVLQPLKRQIEDIHNTFGDRAALKEVVSFNGVGPEAATPPPTSNDDGEGFLRAARIKRRK